jgi:xylulokinase
MYLLGIDLGSSSIKTSLVNVTDGRVVHSVTEPAQEMPILSKQSGWAEQDPNIWWMHLTNAIKKMVTQVGAPCKNIRAIGIAYQMHGLVTLDSEGKVLRPAIIWCDSRAVDLGNRAFELIGKEKCLETTLNSPGNFTASKLKWVKDNEPNIYDQIHKILLPGDYIAYKLSGDMTTTISGLSEGVFWDFKNSELSSDILDFYGISRSVIPDVVPSIGLSGRLMASVADELGLEAGIPITYRAGDQPNNALSLNVMQPGEMAATGGTSGVVYGVSESCENDPANRVNIFAHVNHSEELSRLGILLCINGCGILNSWMRKHLKYDSYEGMNKIATDIPIGSDGLCVLPFGNGAERLLGNRDIGSQICNLNFNRHSFGHLLRSSQEGIAFAFKYGLEIMDSMGFEAEVMRAGKANLFLSELFRKTLATCSDISIEMYDTDGSKGAALGAGVGAGIYASIEEALANLKLIGVTEPDTINKAAFVEAYEQWRNKLEFHLEWK